MELEESEHFKIWEEINQEYASSIIKMIDIWVFQPNENDIKQLENFSHEEILRNHEDIIKIDLSNIEILFKQEEELKISEEDIEQDILNIFQRNWEANNKKRGRSSVVRFLIENNLDQDEENDKTNQYIKTPKTVLDKLDTFMNESNKFIQDNNIDEYKNEGFEKRANEIFQVNNCLSQENTISDIKTISDTGKLIVIFASILVSMNHVIDATKVINSYGLKYKKDKFWLANMNKLYGLLSLIDESRDISLEYFNKALKLFKELKSLQGEAIIYYLKSIALRIHDYEDEYNNIDSLKESKRFAERAMIYFKFLKHYEGFMKCSKLCEKSENPPNKHTKLNILGDPNYIPYIERKHRFEFFSLGIEPVLTTKFEIDIDVDELRLATVKNYVGLSKRLLFK